MTDKKIIRGAKGGKGGGGGGRVAQEAPDSLRSVAYASVLDLVCEGEIEGLANGLKSVYFDQTPLQNDNGSFNFTGATVVATNGSQSQSYIQGFPAVENELPVGIKVEYASPIVRSITDEDVDAVRVRISIPQLTEQNTTNGDLNGSEVTYAIDVQSNGGGYIPQILSDGWTTGSVNRVSTTSAKATIPVTQVSIGINKLTSNAAFTVQYKLQSDSVWLTDGITSIDGNAVNSISGKSIEFIASATNIAFGKKIYTMPVRDFGLWEMRVVISSGSAQIVSAAGNSGTPSSTVKGKTTSKYERSHRLKLTGEAPWDVRVRRINLDASTVAVQNDIYWESYTEIIDGKFRYPNSAIVGVRIDSSQFNNIPSRAYDLKLIKVKIPSNYDPITRVYTGVWDGTFNVAWSDNPAWCFYDLLTNDRYGLGEFIPEAQVDKWTLYAIGRYCDELVDDGFGNQEPRFTCNIYMQTREEAYNVINSMASIFRGMPYWSSGSITLGYDAPSDPVYQFTNANVIDGSFNYSGSAVKARHTVALVSWNDPEDFYRQKVEYVENADGISRYGIIQTEIVAVGCTSRGQANRVGRWLLYTEQSETEIVNFKTGLEGHALRPSQIIQVADEMRAGTRRGGRISSATTTAITVDMNVSGISGITSGTLSVILPDGTLETKNISTVSTNVITVSSAFSDTPASNAVWMVQTSSVEAQTYRVISVIEAEDGLEVSALAHDPDKYALVEDGLTLSPRSISALSIVPDPPTNLSVSETLYEQGAEVKVLVTLSWTPAATANSYIVSYRINNGNFITLPNTTAASIDIRDTTDGIYTFKVSSVNAINKRSIPTELTSTIYGKTLPPEDVTNFSINVVGSQAYLTWDAVGDLDLDHYIIRHSRSTSGAIYSKSVDLISKVPRPAVFAIAPAMTGTYFIKAVDKSGYESANATEIVALIENIKDLNIIETITESPSFSGSKVECLVNEEGLLVLDTASNFDDITGLFDDAEGDFDGGGGTTSTEGTYYFDCGGLGYVDLGSSYTSRITAILDVDRIDYTNLFDDRTGNFDDATGLFDGDPSTYSDTNVELYVATTDDDPSGTPTWTNYRKFFVGDYKARALKFKAVLTSRSTESSPAISSLSVTIDMPDRVASGNDIASGTGSGGYSVTFTPNFKVTPALGIAAQNLAQGDYYEITTKSASGFTIRFKNSSGTVVNRTFDYVAKGYGELAA